MLIFIQKNHREGSPKQNKIHYLQSTTYSDTIQSLGETIDDTDQK